MSACKEFYPRCLCNQCVKKGNGCCIKHHRVCHEANNYVDSNVCSGFVKKVEGFKKLITEGKEAEV